MSAVLVALIVCGSGLWLWHRAEPRLDRWLDHRAPPEPVKDIESDPMPQDLVIGAMAFSEEWARDQALERLRELRVEYGSWDKARLVAGPSLGKVA